MLPLSVSQRSCNKCSSCHFFPPPPPKTPFLIPAPRPPRDHEWLKPLLSPPPPPPPMTSSSLPSSASAAPPGSPSLTNYLTNLGLGYSIALALGFLFLLSTLLLVSYICCGTSRRRSRYADPVRQTSTANPSNSDGINLSRIIFVAEDDDDDPDRDEENAVMGLDQNVINSYPKFPFAKDKYMGNANTTCSICLCEYKDSEMLRMMPECRHFFHLCCLDAWLKLNGSCPVCRNSPLPTPLSTPLQEVVPLSQYAADRWRR